MIGLPNVSENKLKLMLLLSDEYGWSNREITDLNIVHFVLFLE